LQRAV